METINVESMPRSRDVTNEHHLEGKMKIHDGRSMDSLLRGRGASIGF